MSVTAAIMRIAVSNLIPSPNNPRKHFDEAKLKELSESIASPIGQQVPLLVRRWKNLDGYEILDGERRWRAAKLAELASLECKVVEVDDAHALEITVIANLQRSDVTPLEEANGVAALLGAGRDVEAIAKDLGKSIAWVYLRAKLSELSPKWRKAIEDPRSDVEGWPASKLDLIARFPAAQQDEMLEDWSIVRAENVKRLAEVIDRSYLRSLKSAPWSLDDEKLVAKAGACRTCPKRTSCQQQLFSASKDDRCTDGACWASKGLAHLAAREKELENKHPDLIKLDKESYSSPSEGVKGYGQVVKATKSDPKAKPALIVNGPGIGQIEYVKPGSGGSSGINGRPTGPVPVKERLEQRLRSRRVLHVEIVKHLLQGHDRLTGDPAEEFGTAKLTEMGFGSVKRPDRTMLVAMAAAFGFDRDWSLEHEIEPIDEETWANLRAHAKLSPDKLDERLWQRCVHEICTGQLEDDDDIGPLCDIVGLDDAKIIQAVMVAKPLPKTLAATFNEDGTPRKGLTASVKKPINAAKSKSATKGKKAKAGAA